jgi:hypothetical protein
MVSIRRSPVALAKLVAVESTHACSARRRMLGRVGLLECCGVLGVGGMHGGKLQ